MAVYIPTIWKNDEPPAVNATNLNKIEAGIEQCSLDTIASASIEGSGGNLTITLARQSGSSPVSDSFDLVSWLSASAFYSQTYIDACFQEHDAIDWDPPLEEEE